MNRSALYLIIGILVVTGVGYAMDQAAKAQPAEFSHGLHPYRTKVSCTTGHDDPGCKTPKPERPY
jgi:hypothetical protein